MSQPFPGLTEADFDAYLPARATSNAFVRARLPVKEKLLALGRDLAERARTAGLSLDVHASDERPSVWNKKSVTAQWVFLWRDRAEREALERVVGPERPLGAALLDPTPYYQHAFLALLLDAAKFEITLRVHAGAWADVKNLRQRLETDTGRAAITAAFATLPADFVVGVTGSEHAVARGIDATLISTLLAQATTSNTWLAVSREIPRADVAARASTLGDEIQAAFDALLPLYKLVAWRRDDDPAHVAADLEREQRAREAHLAEASARQAEWSAQHDAEIERRREVAAIEAKERAAALERARPAVVQAALPAPPPPEPRVPERRPIPERRAPDPRPAANANANANAVVPASARPARNPEAPRSAPAVPRAMRWVESDDPITLGGRVRIRSGPFAGKEGTVTELDPRGVAKISLGLISARVEATQLVTLSERPA